MLPSDPRLGEMTEEQMDDLFQQIDYLHPSEEKQVLRDDEYDESEAESAGVLWEDEEVTAFGAQPPPPPVDPEWVEMTAEELL